MRRKITGIAAIALFLALGLTAGASSEGPALSPEKILAELKASNERYVTGKTLRPNATQARREETTDKGQHPVATFLSCSDSRVPVELIFDSGIGDLFVVRDAGNVCGSDEIGSIEYGVEHLGTPLLVVLGHSKCGAVTAAATNAAVGGSIPVILERILPAVATTRQSFPGFDASALIPEIIKANVWHSIQDLYQRSAIVRELVHEKKVKVVGAIYDIQSGRVQWLGPHPQEAALLGGKVAPEAGHGAAGGHAAEKKVAAAKKPGKAKSSAGHGGH